MKVKSITKKITAALLGCVIAGSFALPLTACFLIPEPSPGPQEPVIPDEVTQNITLTEEGAELSWSKVEGAETYAVYYSPSRLGEYTLKEEKTRRLYTAEDKYGYYRVDALDEEAQVIQSNVYSYEQQIFGDTVNIYAPTDDQSKVQTEIDEFRKSTSQFGEGRFAALFKKGDYKNLNLVMRYYMTFAGLGKLPTDAVLGKFNTYGELPGGNATCNFWCGIENMTVNSNVQWAVSQATSFRRMQVSGNLTLHDKGDTPWASGGFISDSVVTGAIDGSVQQQWFTRNSDWGSWSGGDINMVFAGCSSSLDYRWGGNYGNGWVTYLPNTTVMREKPYLVFDEDKGFSVCVPGLKKNFKGVSWKSGSSATNYIGIEEFYVAQASRDNSQTLNAALQEGKNILFTPGIYNIDSPLLVENKNTVIMGIGLASLKLTAKNTDTIMRISDVDGVSVSGIMFDAGPKSKTLLEVGTEKTSTSHADNPTVLSDLYFRIGGAGSGATSVDKTLVINSNNVVGDNFWVWRADHGNGGTVGWNVNKAVNGVIVNGDNVTVYGLMVEHFQQYQTIWNGENGYVAFYQSETPYDAPNQSAWMSKWNNVTYEGYASYKVADTVKNHTAHGLGVYYVASYELQNVFNLDHGIELPSNSGINVQHMGIANFLTYGNNTDDGGIRHIVNQYGAGSYNGWSKQHWQSFVGGVATA